MAAGSGIFIYLSYSAQYDRYRDRDFAAGQATAMATENADTVFVAISSAAATPDLPRLSDRSDPFTQDVQFFINELASHDVRACASILSDFFIGSPAQMERVVLVDHVVAFNRSRAEADAGFVCVTTDLEMRAGSRSSETYDRWRLFHLLLRQRIAAQAPDLKLQAYLQGPDFLIQRMDDPDDQAALMEREGITQISTNPTLYRGALAYFTRLEASAIADAVMPMWYFARLRPFIRRLDHNIQELEGMAGDKPGLVAGIKVSDGTCIDDCVQTRDDYLAALAYAERVRGEFASFLGTSVFKWPFPEGW